MGPLTVDASRYAVTTHDRCCSPPRSPTIVGSAVDTIVWSSDASRITIISAPKITRTRSAGRSGALEAIALRLTTHSCRSGDGRECNCTEDRPAADQRSRVARERLRDHV